MTSTVGKGAKKEKLHDVLLAKARHCLSFVLPRVPPPSTSVEVVRLLAFLGMTPKHVHKLNQRFQELKEHDPITLTCGPDEVSTESVQLLVRNRRIWVVKILNNLMELGGFSNIISWDGFLYVLLRFCTLSKVELCQVMFFIIAKDMKSWTVQSLTTSQMEEFYEDYEICPVEAFNTHSIEFQKLPLAKYRMHEFIQLVYKYSQLINPCTHLQRSLMQALPDLAFWSNFDSIKSYNRKITLDFFRHQKLTSMMELLTGAAQAEVEVPIIMQPMPAAESFNALTYGAPVKSKREPAVQADLPLPLGPSKGVRHIPDIPPQVPVWLSTHNGVSTDPQWEIKLRGQALELAPLLGGLEIPRNIEIAKTMVLQTHAKALMEQERAAELILQKQKDKEQPSGALDDLKRCQELDFIRKSREIENRHDDIVTIIGKATPCEMIRRPQKKVAGFT